MTVPRMEAAHCIHTAVQPMPTLYLLDLLDLDGGRSGLRITLSRTSSPSQAERARLAVASSGLGAVWPACQQDERGLWFFEVYYGPN